MARDDEKVTEPLATEIGNDLGNQCPESCWADANGPGVIAGAPDHPVGQVRGDEKWPPAGRLAAHLVSVDGVGAKGQMGAVLLKGTAGNDHRPRLIQPLHKVGHADLLEDHAGASWVKIFRNLGDVPNEPF
jgi:hypothetical protein